MLFIAFEIIRNILEMIERRSIAENGNSPKKKLFVVDRTKYHNVRTEDFTPGRTA